MAAVALLAIVSCTAVSCGSGTSKQGQSAPAAHATANSTVLEVDSLLKNAETLVGQPVVVEGVCTHICQHGGGKIFLMGSDDTQTIRIDAGEKVGKFTPETVRSTKSGSTKLSCPSGKNKQKHRQRHSMALPDHPAKATRRPAAKPRSTASKSESRISASASPSARPKRARTTCRSIRLRPTVMKSFKRCDPENSVPFFAGGAVPSTASYLSSSAEWC